MNATACLVNSGSIFSKRKPGARTPSRLASPIRATPSLRTLNFWVGSVSTRSFSTNDHAGLASPKW